MDDLGRTSIQNAREITHLLKMIAHPTRVLILLLLVDEAKTVSDIQQSVGVPQAMVSQHLAQLRTANVLARRKVGRSAYYEVADPRIKPLLRLLQFPSSKRDA
ncbi:helix-turn-helix transcriptional regulator [Rhizobium cauense]|uniref:ArsR/SmtB family transcription factor n=1 Tax=Rhizobium cauense TaxID=1166683 RepID=UPI001C6E2005|nr:helix-turn-helix transcriptional regulator [Rhizobium cauense]